jgi:hypothetical protein
MTTTNLYALLEMRDEPDCRFVAAWLIRAAEAQTLWSEILDSPDSARHVQLLYADGTPELAAASLEILGELEYHFHVVSLNLYPDDSGLFCREFGLLVRLGFFILDGQSYRVAVPDQMVLETVMEAAMELLSTVGDAGGGIDVIQPERQLVTLSSAEANAWRSKLFAMRRFDSDSHRVGRPQ